MPPRRIDWLDVAKGIGILLVVLGHTGSTSRAATNYVFSFHMPLFFVISGYLFTAGKYDFKTYAARKTKSLLVPYLVFAVLSYGFWLGAGRKFGADADLDIPLLQPLLGIFYANGHGHWLIFNTPLWFLPCLFLVEIGFFGLSKLIRRERYLWLALLALSAAGYLDSLYMPVRLPWGADVALTAIVFYGIGHLAKRHAHSLDAFSAAPVRAAALAACALAGYFLSEANGRVDMNLNRYGNYVYFYLAAFAGVAALFLLAQFVRRSGALRFLGENSLFIMATHMLLLSFVKAIVVYVLHLALADTRTAAWAIAYAAGVLLVASPLVYVANRYFGFAIGKSGSGKPSLPV
ncbi:acyltransferase family protein [Cohnella nanjingensis]|uniref:Acyltransferase family protein n=1 Tax=Cohnella nanjingensis TaxID=1387779 RepID=A0A7X0RQB8_9BACL|nr:acyltransferase family protein [Cohnella nanjingensis]MBB6671718.1 acyltransferase family protein [Cohnella nanjingensis]